MVGHALDPDVSTEVALVFDPELSGPGPLHLSMGAACPCRKLANGSVPSCLGSEGMGSPPSFGAWCWDGMSMVLLLQAQFRWSVVANRFSSPLLLHQQSHQAASSPRGCLCVLWLGFSKCACAEQWQALCLVLPTAWSVVLPCSRESIFIINISRPSRQDEGTGIPLRSWKMMAR